MASGLERPRFFEGQYIGSADLEAVVAYARDLGREHALGPHSWGIAAGLDLVEVPAAGGGVDYFVLPGLAWDGYGRAIVLLAPAQVPAAAFAGLPSGDQPVWLRYDETPFSGLREGFQTCGAEEAFARIRESAATEIGPFALAQRQGGVEVAGLAIPDARLVLRSFRDTASVFCDGSVPYQAFPEDRARWLVPIGVATWQNGAPGSLQPRSDTSLKLSRTLRRMAGTVAESLYAADGVIRLRDRFEQFRAGVSIDDLCAAHALKPEDLINAPDVTDSSKVTDRLVGRELVWIEGDLRVTGQARLFGTRLELRDAAGAEAGDAPLYARRAVSPNNPLAGQDFQVVIGEQPDGKHRFAVGTAEDYGDLAERLLLRNDGVFAIGDPIPSDLKSDHGLIAHADGLTLGLATSAAKTAKVAFQALPTLAELAHLAYDDATRKLRLGAGTDLARFTTWTASGQVGIGIDTPEAQHIDADDLVVRAPGNAGLTLLGDPESRGSLHFADHVPVAGEIAGGFIRYEHLAESLKFGTNHEVRVAIDATGDLGLGTEAPSARIDIRETGTARALKLDPGSIRAEDAGGAARLDLQSGPFNAVTCFQDRVGVNLGTAFPDTTLHVRGTRAQNAAAPSAHVALIENMAGSDADVLALRIAGGVADANNNFVTFFDSTGVIGRIERSTFAVNTVADPSAAGTFLRLVSGGADFAECLPRADTAAPIGPGRIVGVRRGHVSLATEGADALLVTTDRAVVLGNAPPGEDGSREMVALVGQVLLRVEGPVTSGDYILPSGREDGSGRAVAAASLTPPDAGRVVGRAWADAPRPGVAPVLVAIGVQGADALSALSAAFARQQRTIEALERALAKLEVGEG